MSTFVFIIALVLGYTFEKANARKAYPLHRPSWQLTGRSLRRRPHFAERKAAMSDIHLDPMIVGEVIAQYRQDKGITQEVLSGLADIGRTHLSAIERGERKPTLETLYKISQALEVDMSTIVRSIESEMEKRGRA